MPNILKITAENADELLNTGAYAAGAVIRVQSSATETGTYADISGTGSTPTISLVSGTRNYTAYDPAGASTTWYRTRYENAGATRLSDWTAVFQVGDESAGQLCSIYDVKQRLTSNGGSLTDSDEELAIEIISQISAYITTYCGRRFTPVTTTYLFHTTGGRVLRIPRGIQSITTLGVATVSQPSTGGTYTTVASTSYIIDPPTFDRSSGWPGTSVVMLDNAGAYFYNAYNGASILGTFGFAAVPKDIEAVALRLVVADFRQRSSSGLGDALVVNVDGERRYERALSYSDRMTLERYREPLVG